MANKNHYFYTVFIIYSQIEVKAVVDTITNTTSYLDIIQMLQYQLFK